MFPKLKISISESDNNGIENVTGFNYKYFDSGEFIKQFYNSKCFSTLHLNIASLTNNFDELQTFLSLLYVNFSIIGINRNFKMDSIIY